LLFVYEAGGQLLTLSHLVQYQDENLQNVMARLVPGRLQSPGMTFKYHWLVP